VRLPGERGLTLSRLQARAGIELHAGILPALAPWAERYGVRPPAPIA
jgi:L-lactate dehydrogenase